MNKIGKLALTATSLAPILGALAVNSLAKGNYGEAVRYLLAGGGMVLVCWLLLLACRRLQEEPLTTAKVKTADKEVLSFLVVYLLPIFTKNIIFTDDWITPVYVVAIIGACVYNSNAFTFNPVMSLMHYHFYEVEVKDGMAYLLITKQTLRRNDNTLEVRELSDYIYLQA
ncbi:MAG: hypothetical protein JWN86_1326 [Planctomycetota bacterium]|nr:hypothetical protein [Planctomycetota bacterium]